MAPAELGWVEDLPEGGTRHLVGWDPKMEGNFEEIWRSGNSWWRLEPARAVRCDIGIILTPDNVVACVAKINGIIKRDDMRMALSASRFTATTTIGSAKPSNATTPRTPLPTLTSEPSFPPAKSLKTLKSLIANLRILAQRHVKRLILTHIVRLSYVAPDELGLVCTVDGFGLI